MLQHKYKYMHVIKHVPFADFSILFQIANYAWGNHIVITFLKFCKWLDYSHLKKPGCTSQTFQHSDYLDFTKSHQSWMY